MNVRLLRLPAVAVLLANGVFVAPTAAEDQNSNAPKQLIPRVPGVPALYRLGPGDEIRVQQQNAEELDGKTARVDALGYINLPLTGRLQLSGLTLEEAEKAIASRLSDYLLNPRPVVSITEYRSQPVSVLGAVNTPGVIQLQGRKTLIELLSMAGGIRQDAGTELEVTRRLTYGPIPVKDAVTDGSGQYSTAKIDLAAVLKGTAPETNIEIDPQDVISVPRAELIYVTGCVKKPGGFALSTNGSVSVLQAISLAEGTAPQASTKNARILRASNGDGPKQQIPVNVAAILVGKQPDFDLKPRDVLFIPDSIARKAGVRAAEAALQAATGVAIWRAW
jgi:polysaccharide export outer membrane protein